MKKKKHRQRISKRDDPEGVIEDLAARQRFGRAPKRMADILSRLIARKGYGRLQSTAVFEEAWKTAVGELLAGQSRPGSVRRGTLEVIVQNSAVAQELQFNKQQVLGKLKKLVSDYVIHDIRFRVGAID
jgi:predicted nucleic acid-binding Zn ribbon protein